MNLEERKRAAQAVLDGHRMVLYQPGGYGAEIIAKACSMHARSSYGGSLPMLYGVPSSERGNWGACVQATDEWAMVALLGRRSDWKQYPGVMEGASKEGHRMAVICAHRALGPAVEWPWGSIVLDSIQDLDLKTVRRIATKNPQALRIASTMSDEVSAAKVAELLGPEWKSIHVPACLPLAPPPTIVTP